MCRPFVSLSLSFFFLFSFLSRVSFSCSKKIFPTVLGVILGCSHLVTGCSWIALRLLLTTELHCGYLFPWSLENLVPWLYGGPAHHDRHHEKTQCNFASSLVFWDWLLGTAAPQDNCPARRHKSE